MSPVSEQPTTNEPDTLRSGVLGGVGIVFFVVAAAAPLAAVTGTSPVVFQGVAIGAPGMFLAAGLVCLLFSVGYAAVSRHITSAGGFAAYIARLLSPRVGAGFAFVAIASYSASLIAVYGLFGSIANEVFTAVVGIELPWQVWTFGTLVVVAILGYFEVRVANRVLGVLLIAELIFLAILATGILTHGGADGIDVESFVPHNILGGAPGMAFMLAFLAFLGFEATALYGEETRDPKRTVPVATYTAVIVITLVYTASTWAIALGWGPTEIATAATNDPANFVFNISDRYLGTPFTNVMQLLVVLSFFATLLSIHSALSRYVYSLGRDRILPPTVGKTHNRFRSPYVASIVESVLCLVVLTLFALFDAEPIAVVFSWLSGVASVGVIVTEAVVSIGVIVFFRRTRLDQRLWHSLLAPALAVLVLCGAEYLALTNYQALAGVDSGWVFALPAALPVAFAIGYVIATRRERAGRRAYGSTVET